MKLGHRRILAVSVALFGMARASAGHAGPLFGADGPTGALPCAQADLVVPAEVAADLRYDREHSATGREVGGMADQDILLGEPGSASPARASGLPLGNLFGDSADLASAR